MKNDIVMIGDVPYYAGVVKKVPGVCLEPQDAGEIELLMDVSSNWMKLFAARNSLSTHDLRKILYIELCGRHRPMMVDRVRALIETRMRDKNIEEIEAMVTYLSEEATCESA